MKTVLHSGKIVDLENITESDICIEDIAHSLSLQCRFNGHCDYFYSVAQHSLNCAEHAQKSYLPYQAQLLALLHDAAESYTGDIIRPIKKQYPQIELFEDNILKVICKKFGIDFRFWTDIMRIDDFMLRLELETLFFNSRMQNNAFNVSNLAGKFAKMEFKEVKSKFIEKFNFLNEKILNSK